MYSCDGSTGAYIVNQDTRCGTLPAVSRAYPSTGCAFPSSEPQCSDSLTLAPAAPDGAFPLPPACGCPAGYAGDGCNAGSGCTECAEVRPPALILYVVVYLHVHIIHVIPGLL